jgi:hypothetical protein
MVAGAGMGIGALSVAMLGLPLTSVLLVVVFLQADQLELMPLVIVAVVVSYVASAWLPPPGRSPRAVGVVSSRGPMPVARSGSAG